MTIGCRERGNFVNQSQPSILLERSRANQAHNAGGPFMPDVFSYEAEFLFKKPWMVVCAGPELDRHIEDLQRNAIEQSHMIVCVDRALVCLAHHKIVPDAVISIEWQAESAKFLDDIPDAWLSVPLIASTNASPEFINRWKGPVFWFVQGIGDMNEENDWVSRKRSLSIFPSFRHVGGTAVFLAKGFSEAPDQMRVYGNDYWYYGAEIRGRLPGEIGFICTKYYATPIPTEPRIQWRYDSRLTLHDSDDGHKYTADSYPWQLEPLGLGVVGRWTDHNLHFLKHELGLIDGYLKNTKAEVME